jgi:hypothetical protein
MGYKNLYLFQTQGFYNFGDYITKYIFDKMDFEIGQGNYFLGCGSILHQSVFQNATYKNFIVWGAGIGENSKINRHNISEHGKFDIYSVRGPKTAKLLGIENDVPYGDLGLLMPCFYKPKYFVDRVVYTPHWLNYHNIRLRHRRSIYNLVDCDLVMSPLINAETFEKCLDDISSAGFILTNSLHGSIIAHAYGRPWAPCRYEKEHVPNQFKWLDWFEYIGLPDEALYWNNNYKSSKLWHDKWSPKMKRPEIGPIINSFPEPEKLTKAILDSRIR